MRGIILLVAVGCFAGCRVVPIKTHVVDVRPRPVMGLATNGNVYTITANCRTNHPDLVNLRWPKRVHINLRAGSTSRRIAYGLPTINDRTDISYEYAIPWWDRALLTTNATIEVTDLGGSSITTSDVFTVAGAYVVAPATGPLVNGAWIDLTFFQTGGPGSWRFGYINPSSEFTLINTLTDIIDGSNTVSWQVSLPVTNQIKLAFQSIDEPLVWAVTTTLESL